MRTTLDIEDGVLAAAKELAQRQDLSAGQVVSRLLRSALTGEAPTQHSGVAVVAGFRPLAASDQHLVSNAQIDQLRDLSCAIAKASDAGPAGCECGHRPARQWARDAGIRLHLAGAQSRSGLGHLPAHANRSGALMAQPAYPNTQPAQRVAARLAEACDHPSHAFASAPPDAALPHRPDQRD